MRFVYPTKHSAASTPDDSARHDIERAVTESRAIDMATRLYASSEHEHRRRRFDLAVSRASSLDG